jgi:polyisoprenoid-binding protein YceI
MFRFMAIAVMATILPMGSGYWGTSTAAAGGQWQIDTRHSAVQLISDATTEFGKKKISYTLGYARVNGEIMLDDANVANSKFELHMYPADAMAPPIGEGGKTMNQYMADMANHTLICFHSKEVTRTADGKVKVAGELVLTRVDRNVEIEPSEAYSGPTYGPPIVHRVVREVSFTFDPPAAKAKNAQMTGSTNLARENYPHLVKAVLTASWPPLVQDEKSHNTAGGTEDYHGNDCTGHYLSGSGLPPAPVQVGEDYPGASDFNHILGNQLQIVLHLQLSPGSAPTKAAAM